MNNRLAATSNIQKIALELINTPSTAPNAGARAKAIFIIANTTSCYLTLKASLTATVAITPLAAAPKPCIILAYIKVLIWLLNIHIIELIMKKHDPTNITGLRPNLSENGPYNS